MGTMKYIVFLLSVYFLNFHVSAIVTLVKGVKERVTYEGYYLRIRYDNPKSDVGTVTICIQAEDHAVSPHCPGGYNEFSFFVDGNKNRSVVFNMTSDGKITPEIVKFEYRIHYDVDSSVEFLLAEIPDKVIVTLLNADRVYKPQKKKKPFFNEVVIILSVWGGALILLTIILIILVWCCIYRKKPTIRNSATVPETD